MSPVFKPRELAAVAISAALWAILNVTIVPVFWTATKLPILCDLIGVCLFLATAWWTGKPGAVAMMGAVATLLNFAIRPGSLQFLGFTVAALVFDLALTFIGYQRVRAKDAVTAGFMVALCALSATAAGAIIGTFFMPPAALAGYGGAAAFAALHGAGGLAGGLLGVVLTRALDSRLGGVPQ